MWRWLLIIIGLTAQCTSNAAENPFGSEFLLFPTVHIEHLSGLKADSELDDQSIEPGLSVFYTAQKNKWNILAEVFLSEDEQEVERLLAGWTIKDSNVLWIGRYHNPIGYWNLNNHHGAYLSTPVSRPAIVEFEDDGGVIPTHNTGFLFQGSFLNQSSELKYNIGLGLAPTLGQEGLEPFDTFNLGDNNHDPAFTAHISYSPDGLGRHEMGGFYNVNDINSTLTTIDRIEQQIMGMFYHANLDPYTVSVSLFNITNKIYKSGVSQTSSFSNIFILLERQLNQSWSVYISQDYTPNADRNEYVALFPAFVTARSSVGARFDFFDNQALTFEVATVDVVLGDHVHTTLQWSAVFP
ncbi:MAG: hypothetical protein ACC707_03215 [Thiohalomonadales bacterium]